MTAQAHETRGGIPDSGIKPGVPVAAQAATEFGHRWRVSRRKFPGVIHRDAFDERSGSTVLGGGGLGNKIDRR